MIEMGVGVQPDRGGLVVGVAAEVEVQLKWGGQVVGAATAGQLHLHKTVV